jgi:hypothetical protein
MSYSMDPYGDFGDAVSIGHTEPQSDGDPKNYNFSMSMKGLRELLDRLEMHPDTGPLHCLYGVSVLLDKGKVRMYYTVQTVGNLQEPVEVTLVEFMQIPKEVWRKMRGPTALKEYKDKHFAPGKMIPTEEFIAKYPKLAQFVPYEVRDNGKRHIQEVEVFKITVTDGDKMDDFAHRINNDRNRHQVTDCLLFDAEFDELGEANCDCWHYHHENMDGKYGKDSRTGWDTALRDVNYLMMSDAGSKKLVFYEVEHTAPVPV